MVTALRTVNQLLTSSENECGGSLFLFHLTLQHSKLKCLTQCSKLCKRTGIRCKNPCAYGSKVACKTHGSHRSRNVLIGTDHPRYTHGERTKEFEAEHRRGSITLLTLRDVGDYLSMFNGSYISGRKPNGYRKYDMSDPEQLALAIMITLQDPGEP